MSGKVLHNPKIEQSLSLREGRLKLSAGNFEERYSRYLHSAAKVDFPLPSSQSEQKRTSAKMAMEEAEKTFESMMQIRGQLDKAFKDLVSPQ